MFAPVIGAAYTMTTKREAHWSEQTKAQNTEKGMYVGLKQPRGDGERYVTPARAAAKETSTNITVQAAVGSSTKQSSSSHTSSNTSVLLQVVPVTLYSPKVYLSTHGTLDAEST